MSTSTFGMHVVDWEARVDMDRLRTERLARLKAQATTSSVGSLLTFDFHNIRYMTATHIGTWAMDKMIRFALLPQGGEPVVWDFGSAAKHHQAPQPVARLPRPRRRGRGRARDVGSAGGDLGAARGVPPRRGHRRGGRRQDLPRGSTGTA
ncbi:hypothetical protein GCM10025868_36230 [Angustibacter aerolatus]|uniref:Creatinase N-terminal domain-containing protein n=1 Tax=Angustibacter aerolatus TaxID=1162965 RepID=A0ABQ6JK48_9ACTN|nr:hypothetical protein [Angustibacter aerolatus]GMA88373.1 hypothetical protein GCM10025868_36230 [Angustibacter aerolatus]